MTNLQRIRKDRHFSQRELADKSGVNFRTLQDYEQGRKQINQAAAIMVVRLAEVLRCTVNELMEPEESSK